MRNIFKLIVVYIYIRLQQISYCYGWIHVVLVSETHSQQSIVSQSEQLSDGTSEWVSQWVSEWICHCLQWPIHYASRIHGLKTAKLLGGKSANEPHLSLHKKYLKYRAQMSRKSLLCCALTIFRVDFFSLFKQWGASETHNWVETCNCLLYASKQASDYSIC